jgi:multiple sugar transport system ATP-binding protein
MASLSLKHIYKVYSGNVKAVNDFCMEIEDKEFIVFVGPSGCGKSTTLRMIAGLEDITAGELRIDNEVVNDFEPKDRNIAMVFQNYALYPHMSVYDNMAFALRTAKMDRETIHQKVVDAAAILGITEYLDRKPKALSGGQRQRVALGRAIVRNPKVFLLDEPLSNLDAKLRAAMRAEITRLHERLQTTFIYVTHDQVEAMTMGTRIVVMKLGYVQQIDTPQNLYKYPNNIFVAGFIGTPQMNFFDGVIRKNGQDVCFALDCGTELHMDYKLANKILVKYMDGQHKIVFGVRPDDVRLDRPELADSDWVKTKAVVGVVEALGGETLLYCSLQTDQVDGKEGAIIIKADADCTARRGDIVDIAISKRNFHVFDKETEQAIKKRLPQENVADCTIEGDMLAVASQRFRLPAALRQAQSGECVIPTSAMLLGKGEGSAQIVGVEQIEKETLYELSVGDLTMFAREAGEPRYTVGAAVAFDIDWKQVAIHGKVEVEPLCMHNSLDGALVKIKEKVAGGKTGYNFYIQVQDSLVGCSDAVASKLFATKGTKIFKTPLAFEFEADALTLARQTPERTAFAGEVKEVLDYGKERYARLDVLGHSVVAPLHEEIAVGEQVQVIVDQGKMLVKDTKLDIIIA